MAKTTSGKKITPPKSAAKAVTGLIDQGKTAPAFTLLDQTRRNRSLKDLRGKWVVLYFYPKDDTSGCTKEACQFRDAMPTLKTSKAVVLGVSPDDEASHTRFREKYDLPFDLLADTDKKVCAKFGVWQQKSMYGRKYMGVVRTTYLIDPKGKVARRWDKVKVPGHEREVLDAIRGLR